MVSVNQTETVKKLESEGWTIVPAPDQLAVGGPIVMQRVTPQATVDRVTVIPDGEVLPNAG